MCNILWVDFYVVKAIQSMTNNVPLIMCYYNVDSIWKAMYPK